MIEIKNVSKSYVKEKKSINNLNLEIKKRRNFWLFRTKRSWKNYYNKNDYRYFRNR